MVHRVLMHTSAIAIVATLGFTGLASAKAGDRSFEQTYPYASALCTKANNGTLPPRLRASSAQVKNACATLRGGFLPLRANVQAANIALTTGVANDRAAIKAACVKGADRATCRQTRRQERLAIQSLRAQHRAAVRLYYTSVEANRRTFWSTIRSLRGGSTVTPDRPIAPQNS